ncbi:MAG: DUF4105 domain-containing protein [Myxococcota bacterium]
MTVVFLLLASTAATLNAAPATPAPYQVTLLTFGPGDHPFFKFGHDAIWVHDRHAQTDEVYNFGTFDFDNPWLIPEFLQGKLTYWVSVQGIEETLWHYRSENRSITAQRLNLQAGSAKALVQRLRHLALPENRNYQYDYYLNNCATRIRDVIDDAVNGQLHQVSLAPAPLTWRAHSLRLTHETWWLYLGVHILMGDFVDQPINLWQEMFLPEKLHDGLQRVTVPDVNGNPVPLVAEEIELVRAERPPALTAPPSRWPIFALAGLLLGGLLMGLGHLSRSRPWARKIWGLLIGGIGVVCGLLGIIFVLMWAFTNHAVTYANENIWLFPPWALGLAWLGARVWRGKEPSAILAAIAPACLASALLGLALKTLPAFDQQNLEFIVMMIPLWGFVAASARRVIRMG